MKMTPLNENSCLYTTERGKEKTKLMIPSKIDLVFSKIDFQLRVKSTFINHINTYIQLDDARFVIVYRV